MIFRNLISILLVVCGLLGEGYGQGYNTQGDEKEAKTVWDWGDYRAALKEYEQLILQDSRNEELYYKLGVCYYETRSDIAKSVHYFEAATKASAKYPDDLYLRYGKALALNLEFDKAIAAFQKVITDSPGNKEVEEAKRRIEMCQNAKELTKFPRNVTFKNMGEEVNSEAPEYFPMVDAEESILYFVTRRQKMNTGYQAMDGWYTAEIFMLKEKRGNWSKAKNAGGLINSAFDEEIVGISPNGEYIVITKESFEFTGDIYIGKKRGRSIQKPEPPLGEINSTDLESTGIVSNDGNMIIFSSERKGGPGKKDLWIAKKLPTDEWGVPYPLPGKVNTPYNEWMPNLSADGKTLYFSSEGHSSMGGYDIFISEWDSANNEWGTPVNMGYPINTPDDETNIALNGNGRTGYIASARPGGLGGMDIWEVTFPEVEPRYSLIMGNINVMVPIDYNEYITFNYYRKDSTRRRFPDIFKPDDSWTFEESKKDIVKPGFEYRCSLTFQKDTSTVRFSLEKAPLDNPEYVFKDIKMFMTRKKDYKPTRNTGPTHTPVMIKDAFIVVTDAETGELYGEYLPSPETGRYVMILPAGLYEIEIEAEGMKLYNERIKVRGLSSFTAETIKDFTLTPSGELEPIHVSDLKPEEAEE